MSQSSRRIPLPWRAIAWSILAVSLLAISVYAGISILSAHILTSPARLAVALDPRLVGPDPQRWEARTADGVTLRGWFFPTPQHQNLVVCIHGMNGACIDMAGLGHDLRQLGYDVLLFDLRGHGASESARLSMGRAERADLRAVLAWARQQGFTPDRIGWIGESMGAATVLMEGAQNPDIRTAVLDCPYGNLPELLDQQLAAHSGLPRVFNPGIILAARLVFGIRTDDLVPARSASRWQDRPLMVIHGEADSIVPVRQARQIARAAGPNCRLVTLPGVEHVSAYASDPVRYVATVDQFLRQHLGRAADRLSHTVSYARGMVGPPETH
jgi:pimeloyl-ACP methyl ester carboxylesterase